MPLPVLGVTLWSSDATAAHDLERVARTLARGLVEICKICDASGVHVTFAPEAEFRLLGRVIVKCISASPYYEIIEIEQMQADPVALNRNLGAYTNFVNLLDYAALSVPSSLRADGLPFGITLIGVIGLVLNLIGVNPIQFLVLAAITNGLTAPFLMAVIWWLAKDSKLLGKWVSPWWSKLLLGIATLAMTLLPILWLFAP